MAEDNRSGERSGNDGPVEEGRTRARALVAMTVGIVALGILYQAVANGALGVNFTTTDKHFHIYTNYLDGTSAAGFAAPSTKSAGTQVAVAELAVKEAHLAGLCIVYNGGVPGISNLAIVVTAGVPVRQAFTDRSTLQLTDGAGNPITLAANGALAGESLADSIGVHDLFLNASSATAYANKFSGLQLGRSADEVTQVGTAPWPDGQSPPTPGGFGLTGNQLNFGELDGDTYGMRMSGDVELDGLKVRAYPRTADQTDCGQAVSN